MADEASRGEPVRAVAPQGRGLGRKLLLGILVVVALVVAYLVGAAVVPRWWAQRVGGLVDGRLTVGVLTGLAAGSVFTLLPLLALWTGVRFRRGWRRLAGFVALAVVLAAPNLFVLGIVVGDGNAAHAGERILDVEGPGFRGATLVGAIGGALAFVAVLYLAVSRRSARKRAGRLRSELRDHRASATESE